MNGIILLADGFELTEAMAPVDVLRRGSVSIETISISNSLDVKSNIGVVIKAEKTLDTIDYKTYDFVILPGGLGGVSNLKKSVQVIELLRYFNENNKFIFAICAAPSILIDLNFLPNKLYSCYPGCDLNSNGINTLNPITKSTDKIITGKSMYYSTDLGLEILEALLGKQSRDDVENSIKGNRSK